MTLDASKPLDTDLISELASYIRENRTAINAVTGLSSIGFTELEVALGATSLTVGSELGAYGLEIITVDGLGAATLETILGGTAGQVKIFIFQDALVKMSDGNVKTGGEFYLNHLPAASDFEPQQDDVLVLVNIDGDGGSTYGYWKELYRTISVK